MRPLLRTQDAHSVPDCRDSIAEPTGNDRDPSSYSSETPVARCVAIALSSCATLNMGEEIRPMFE